DLTFRRVLEGSHRKVASGVDLRLQADHLPQSQPPQRMGNPLYDSPSAFSSDGSAGIPTSSFGLAPHRIKQHLQGIPHTTHSRSTYYFDRLRRTSPPNHHRRPRP